MFSKINVLQYIGNYIWSCIEVNSSTMHIYNKFYHSVWADQRKKQHYMVVKA